jgi:hypothetical protein
MIISITPIQRLASISLLVCIAVEHQELFEGKAVCRLQRKSSNENSFLFIYLLLLFFANKNNNNSRGKVGIASFSLAIG